MSKARRLLTNFSKGQLSPLVEGRPDLASYFEGAKELTNVVILRQGGITRSTGTRFLAEVKDSTSDTVLMPFEFSVDDSFVIEMGSLYARFYKNKARILNAGVPVEVVTPYATADLRAIHATQSADVLFLFHAAYAQRKLSRVSDTNWSLTQTVYKPPPSFVKDVDLAATLAYTAATGTGVTFRAGSAVFLNADVGRQILAGTALATIKTFVDTQEVTADIQDAFSAGAITAGPGTVSTVGTAATMSVAHGLAVGDFVALTSGAQSGQIRRVTATPTTTTATLAEAFSLDQTTQTWNKVVPLASGAWKLHLSPQTTLDPDKKNPVGALVTLVAGVAAFRSTDVGKFVVIYGGVVELTIFTSSTSVAGLLRSEMGDATQADPPASPAGAWTLETASWDATNGFPRTGEFFQGRLAQAGTTAQPVTVWLSASNDFEDYAIGVFAENALTYPIASRQVNRTEWLADNTDLFVGTSGAEIRMQGGKLGEPLGGDVIPLVVVVTRHGSAPMQPVVINKRVLFVDRSRLKLFALGYSIQEDDADTMEVTAISDQIFGSGVRLGSVSYQKRPDPRLYWITEDGDLVTLTFYLAEKVVGFTVLTAGGTDTFESYSVIPGPVKESDQVYVIAKRTINGVTKRYVEVVDAHASEMATRRWTSLQTQCAVLYTAFTGTVLTGLSHLEARTVDVIVNNSFVGALTVTSGQVTLAASVTNAVVEVGIHYDSTAITMRPAIEGAMIEGLPRSWDKLWVRLHQSIGGAVNGQALQYPASALDDKGLFTGDVEITGYGWDTDGRITITQTQPYPFTVLAVFGELSVSERG